MTTSVAVPTNLPAAESVPQSPPPVEQPQAVTSKVNGREFVYFLGARSLGSAFLNWEANKVAKNFVGIFWITAMIVVGLFEAFVSGWIRKIFSYLEENPQTPPPTAEKETAPEPKTEAATQDKPSDKPQTEAPKRTFQHFLPTPDEYDQHLHPQAETAPQQTPPTLPLPPPALGRTEQPEEPPLPEASAAVETPLDLESAQTPEPLAIPADVETPTSSEEPTAEETPSSSRSWTKTGLGIAAAAGTAALFGSSYQYGPLETAKGIWNVASFAVPTLLATGQAVGLGSPAVKAIWNEPNLKTPAALAGTAALGLSLYQNGFSETFNHSLASLVFLGQARRVFPEAQAIWQNKGFPAAVGAAAATGIGCYFLGLKDTADHGLRALSALSLKRSLGPFANSGFQLAKAACSEAAKKAWNNKTATAIGLAGALALGYAMGPVAIAQKTISGIWSALPVIHMAAQPLLNKPHGEQNEAEPAIPTQDPFAVFRLFVNSSPEMQEAFLAQLPPDQGGFANFLRQLATHSPEKCEEIFAQMAAAQSSSRGGSSSLPTPPPE